MGKFSENKSVRCVSDTKKKVRCKLRTRRGDLCWHHLGSRSGLRIKTSTLPNGGLGLFAEKDIKKNEKIATFEGAHKKECLEGKQCVQVKRDLYIDISPNKYNRKAGIAQFANTCRKGDACTNNASISVNTRNHTASIKSNRNIKSGSEIFAAYGSSFRI